MITSCWHRFREGHLNIPIRVDTIPSVNSMSAHKRTIGRARECSRKIFSELLNRAVMACGSLDAVRKCSGLHTLLLVCSSRHHHMLLLRNYPFERFPSINCWVWVCNSLVYLPRCICANALHMHVGKPSPRNSPFGRLRFWNRWVWGCITHISVPPFLSHAVLP